MLQEKKFETELNRASLQIDTLSKAKETLTTELGEANALIETLTEQLEEAQESKRGRSPSPSFFK